MGIKFHCEHCGKGIEAPDNSGGKWGKCPGCHNMVYVPAITGQSEELKLAPLDESEILKEKELRKEILKLTKEMTADNDMPEEPANRQNTTSEINELNLKKTIVDYLRNMVDGELETAEKIETVIARHRAEANKALADIISGKMMVSELADIPQQVLAGLIKNLQKKIC